MQDLQTLHWITLRSDKVRAVKIIGKGLCWILSAILKLAGSILKLLLLIFMLICRVFMALVKIATP